MPHIKERRQRIRMPAMLRDDRAEIRMHRRPLLKARQTHRARARMPSVGALHRTNHAEHVRSLRQLRQQLREMHSRRPRRDRPKRSAMIAWRVRLRVKHVNMAWPAPEPEHDYRLRPRHLPCSPSLVPQPKRHRQSRRRLQKRPPRLTAARVRPKISNPKHNRVFDRQKFRGIQLCNQVNWNGKLALCASIFTIAA